MLRPSTHSIHVHFLVLCLVLGILPIVEGGFLKKVKKNLFGSSKKQSVSVSTVPLAITEPSVSVENVDVATLGMEGIGNWLKERSLPSEYAEMVTHNVEVNKQFDKEWVVAQGTSVFRMYKVTAQPLASPRLYRVRLGVASLEAVAESRVTTTVKKKVLWINAGKKVTQQENQPRQLTVQEMELLQNQLRRAVIAHPNWDSVVKNRSDDDL